MKNNNNSKKTNLSKGQQNKIVNEINKAGQTKATFLSTSDKCPAEYSDGRDCVKKYDTDEFVCEGGFFDDFECENDFTCQQFKCLESFDSEDCEKKFSCGVGKKFDCPGEFDRFDCNEAHRFTKIEDRVSSNNPNVESPSSKL